MTQSHRFVITISLYYAQYKKGCLNNPADSLEGQFQERRLSVTAFVGWLPEAVPDALRVTSASSGVRGPDLRYNKAVRCRKKGADAATTVAKCDAQDAVRNTFAVASPRGVNRDGHLECLAAS